MNTDNSVANKKIAMVVPHTHWDREWYETFEQFRFRLIKLTDRLLNILDNDENYKCFCFDGQTIVLEDYLEIRSDNRSKLEKYIKNNRIFIGPWYVLPDEFLVSGEALVRNLLIGNITSEEFGRPMKAGYIPDPFGHIAQLPAILDGFGLNNVFLMRGLGDHIKNEATEFYWEGLDGTKILTVYLMNNYCNLSSLGLPTLWSEAKPDYEEAFNKIKTQIDLLSSKANTPYVLLCNGCDHVVPMPELPEILEYSQERLPDVELVHSSFEEYIQALEKVAGDLQTAKGELHSGKYHPLLSGVFSARMYIKQANNKVQRLLEKWAEPTSALASFFGKPYDRQYVRYAWKELLKNHPHDSICGCSIDQVHREMMPRFDQAEQVGETMTKENLKHIAKNIDTRISESEDYRALVVFNPHGWEVSETATLSVEMPVTHTQLPRSVKVKDETGRKVPCQIVNQKLEHTREPHPADKMLWSFDLLVAAKDVPSFGYKTLFAEWGEQGAMPNMIVATTQSLENPYIRVDVQPNGILTITDKRSGVIYDNCLVMEDTEDAGDEYDWSPIVNSQTLTNHGVNADVSLIETGPVRAGVRIQYTLNIPVSLSEDRLSRTGQTIACKVVHEVRISADSPRVDFKTTVDNQAMDHRLRVHFNAPINVSKHIAETAFGAIERHNRPPKGDNWVQKPQPTHAQQSWTAVDDARYGFAVINVGLPEYEVIETAEGTEIALTLLRGSGAISRDDYLSRPYHAGPLIWTPEAQCIGEYAFEYSLLPYIGEWKKSKPWKSAHIVNTPLRVLEEVSHEGDLPIQISVFSVDNDGIVMSAVKLAERDNQLIVRLYNTTPDSITTTLSTPLNIADAQPVNLNEQLVSEPELIISGNAVGLTLQPYQIATIALRAKI